jgi:hypothetical protein
VPNVVPVSRERRFYTVLTESLRAALQLHEITDPLSGESVHAAYSTA